MFRKLSFGKSHHTSGRKNSNRGKSPRNAILGVERLEWRTMLAAEPLLTVFDYQFFGEDLINDVPFRVRFEDIAEGPLDEQQFTYSIDWGDLSMPSTGTAEIFFGIPETPESPTPIFGRIEAFHTYLNTSPEDGYNVTVTLNDIGNGDSTSDDTFVDVYELASPALTINVLNPDQTINEGDVCNLGLPEVAGIQSWKINWGEGEVDTNPVIDEEIDEAPSPLHAEHQYPDDVDFNGISSEFKIRAAATLTGGQIRYATNTSVHVLPVLPILPEISGPATIDEGTYTLQLDANNLDVVQWVIDWGDLSELQAVSGSFTSLTHTYSAGQFFITAVAIVDGEPLTALPQPFQVNVNSVGPGVTLTDGVLNVVGNATTNSNVLISQSGGSINVTLNGNVPVGFATGSVTEIRVRGGAGNDVIMASPGINKPMTIDGGEGNDLLVSGGGNDVLLGGLGTDILYGEAGQDNLFGGDGNDSLFGGSGNDSLVGGDGIDILLGQAGRDVLIGSDDEDLLSSGDGEDILIGGRTMHDENVLALDAILGIWGSNASFDARVATLTSSGGLLDTEFAVFDDAATDLILGGGGRDLIFGDDLLDIILLSGLDTLIEVT